MVFKNGSWELYGDEGRQVHGRSLCCFSLQHGNIRAVYEFGMIHIVQHHWVVPDEVVDGEVFKKLLGRASNLSVEGSGFVCSFNFAMVEQFLIRIYGGYKRVASNISTRISGLCNRCIMIVEASVIFDELHDGSIRAVYAKGRLDGSIHGNAALLTHGSHGEDVHEGLWVVPHTAKILEVTNLGCNLSTTICVHLEDASTLLDVKKEMTVAENIDCRLTFK